MPTASSGSYDSSSLTTSAADDYADYGGGGYGASSGGGGGGGGDVVATHTIQLSTENGSSTGTLNVAILATWPPSVQLSCSASGAASGQPLLLHWGVSDRRGGTWHSPYDELASVPAGSRAPDAQSCESALRDGQGVVEFAPNHSGITCMTMLIRTENCQEWLRESDGGDVFIDVSPARAAVPGGGGACSSSSRPHPRPRLVTAISSRRSITPATITSPRLRPRLLLLLLLLRRRLWRSRATTWRCFPTGEAVRLSSRTTKAVTAIATISGTRTTFPTPRVTSWRATAIPPAGARSCRRWSACSFDDPGYADIDALGCSSIYLFWVGVGAIAACVEDGSHYRPNHHAGSSQRIYESIENVEKHAMGRRTSRGGGSRVVPSSDPRPPAFTAEFTQSVPLTRIRGHRAREG